MALFKLKLATGVPLTVDTVLGEDVGVAEETAPPASPYQLAPFRTVTAVNPAGPICSSRATARIS